MKCLQILIVQKVSALTLGKNLFNQQPYHPKVFRYLQNLQNTNKPTLINMQKHYPDTENVIVATERTNSKKYKKVTKSYIGSV